MNFLSEFSTGRFERAHQRIASFVRHTPLLPAPLVQENVPDNLILKLENLQISGSFKIRGVFNTLLQLSEAERERGVITASGGNHGVALAIGAHKLGIRCVVYLPATADNDRVQRVERWGATVIKHGLAWDDANAQALLHAEQDNLTYVHPFDAIQTIEGQGTLGLEILEDVPDVDCVLVAIGGGGLISGVSTAIKLKKPEVQIIGVEPVGAPSMLESMNNGAVRKLSEVRTVATTLAPRSVSERTLALSQSFVNQIVLVTDDQMVDAMRWLWVECNQLVEPAGAAVMAAIFSGAFPVDHFKKPVALICGGNADAESVFTTYSSLSSPQRTQRNTETG